MTEEIIKNWQEAFMKCNGQHSHRLPDITLSHGSYKITSISIFGTIGVDFYSEQQIKEMTQNLLNRCETK